MKNLECCLAKLKSKSSATNENLKPNIDEKLEVPDEKPKEKRKPGRPGKKKINMT
jgi:hypothetical protein